MTLLSTLARSQAVRLVALACILGAYGFARLPRLSGAERAELANQFRFTRVALPTLPGEQRSTREVHPTLHRIQAWISSVGAAVALADVDGDGLPNDSCLVDTRTDKVVVAPVPGTGQRFAPFELAVTTLPWDRAIMAPMGCMPGDLNEDGSTDILVYYWGRTPVAFLRATGEPVPNPAAFVAREVMPYQQRWFTNAATRADLDGDGHLDLVFGNYFPDDAWILGSQPTGEATAPQFMQQSMSQSFNGGKNRILLWAGGSGGAAPTLAYNEAKDPFAADVAHAWTLALGAADLDGDLRPEIYFANDFGPDRLLHNRSTPGKLNFVLLEGEKTLSTVRSKQLGKDSFKGMGCDFADINGDGLLDIYISNIAAEWSLEESHFVWVSTGDTRSMQAGRAPYVDQGDDLGLAWSGWGWESRFGDFNNDGVLEAVQATGFVRGTVNRWPELHELAMGNDEMLRHPGAWPRFQPGDDLSGHQHDPFFVRAASGRYYDLAAEVGIATPEVTRGIATADVDGDGDLDFVVANQWDESYFYRNEAPQPGAFLGLNLVIPAGAGQAAAMVRPGLPGPDTPGVAAVGAQALVELPDGRRLVAQVDGGNGHSGKRSPQLHFGLGAVPAGTKVPVELTWRDGAGHLQRTRVQLEAGWHTVLLGARSLGPVDTAATIAAADGATTEEKGV